MYVVLTAKAIDPGLSHLPMPHQADLVAHVNDLRHIGYIYIPSGLGCYACGYISLLSYHEQSSHTHVGAVPYLYTYKTKRTECKNYYAGYTENMQIGRMCEVIMLGGLQWQILRLRRGCQIPKIRWTVKDTRRVFIYP